MKKLLALGLVSAFAANVASANPIWFDPEEDGTLVRVDSFGLVIDPNLVFEVQQFFTGGAVDGQLDNGDTFSESFAYNYNSATDDDSGTSVNYGGRTEFRGEDALVFSFDFTGYITDVTYGAGTPTLGTPSFETDFRASSFQSVFNPTSVDPSVNMTVTYGTKTIGVFDVITGGTDTPIFLDGVINSAFLIDFKFNQAWVDANETTFKAVWQLESGDPLNPETSIAIGGGSAGPTGQAFDSEGVIIDGSTGEAATVASNVDDVYASIAVRDNGATLQFQVPEPASIAALGLGLLGLAGFRRKAK